MHKLVAIVPALLSTVALSACEVEAPERENFDYSFLEEVPEEISPPADLPLAHAPVVAGLHIDFTDGTGGYSDIVEKVDEVSLSIKSVAVLTGHDERWVAVRTDPIEVDLLDLKDGDLETLVSGPMTDGDYTGIRLELGGAYVVRGDDVYPLELPGPTLLLDGEFALEEAETTTLTISFGGLRSLQVDGSDWSIEPQVSVVVEPDPDSHV